MNKLSLAKTVKSAWGTRNRANKKTHGRTNAQGKSGSY